MVDRLTGKLMVVTCAAETELGPGVKPGGPLREARGLDEGAREEGFHVLQHPVGKTGSVCSGKRGFHMRSRG